MGRDDGGIGLDDDGAIIEGKILLCVLNFVGEEGGIYTCHVLGCAKLF